MDFFTKEEKLLLILQYKRTNIKIKKKIQLKLKFKRKIQFKLKKMIYKQIQNKNYLKILTRKKIEKVRIIQLIVSLRNYKKQKVVAIAKS